MHREEIELRERWERRAEDKGAVVDSVLYQGLSGFGNDYINKFHRSCLTVGFVDSLPIGAKVLDVGCGYGRIAKALAEIRPDVEIYGLDFSFGFCRLFKEFVGEPVVCGSLESLPFREQSFDGLILLTCLMYVPDDRRGPVIDRLSQLVKVGGGVFVIEPSQESIFLSGIFHPSSKKLTTGGGGLFSRGFYSLFSSHDFRLEKVRSVSLFTLLLPCLLVLKVFPRLVGWMCRIVMAIDTRSSMDLLIPLHRYAFWKRRD